MSQNLTFGRTGSVNLKATIKIPMIAELIENNKIKKMELLELKKPTNNGTEIKIGTLKAVSIALVLPASPTSPNSTAKLLCEVLKIPSPRPANINIRFWKVESVRINIALAIKCMPSPSMYVYLKPILIPIIGTKKLPMLWLNNKNVTHIPNLFVGMSWKLINQILKNGVIASGTALKKLDKETAFKPTLFL